MKVSKEQTLRGHSYAVWSPGKGVEHVPAESIQADLGRTYPDYFNDCPDSVTHTALREEIRFPMTKDWQRYREAEVEAMRATQVHAWQMAKLKFQTELCVRLTALLKPAEMSFDIKDRLERRYPHMDV